MSLLMIALHLLSLLLGRTFAAAVEWSVHRYLFHVLGKRKGSPFSFHYRDHHRACRKNEMYDEEYTHGSLFAWNGRSREVWAAVVSLTIVAGLTSWWAPLFTVGAAYGGLRYLWVHYKTHVDPEWCRVHAPWHYDHHMAPNQDTNWGVSNEWFDKLMGTRTPWEKRDEVAARLRRRAEHKRAAQRQRA